MKRGAPPAGGGGGAGGSSGAGGGGGPPKLARRGDAPPAAAAPQQPQPDIDPSLRQRMQEALSAAGFAAFRGAQEAAVAGALSGRDVFVLMPTGARVPPLLLLPLLPLLRRAGGLVDGGRERGAAAPRPPPPLGSRTLRTLRAAGLLLTHTAAAHNPQTTPARRRRQEPVLHAARADGARHRARRLPADRCAGTKGGRAAHPQPLSHRNAPSLFPPSLPPILSHNSKTLQTLQTPPKPSTQTLQPPQKQTQPSPKNL